MNINYTTAWELLKGLDNILLLTHRLPDGDAVGSLTALYYVLKQMNKNVTFLLDTVPSNLQNFVPEQPENAIEIENVITLDVGDLKLLTKEHAELCREKVILNIDHHETSLPFAEYSLVNAKAAAACEVLFELFRQAECPVNKKIADSLYVGIATDTGCFRYNNTTSDTLRSAASLMEAGADASKINTDIFETKSKAQVKFETVAMNNLQLHFNGKAALVVIERKDYEDTGMSEADDKSINGLARQIEGVLVGITVKEKRYESGWRVSVRSNEPISAAEICIRLGGGGHRLAAGCELNTTKDEMISKLLDSVAISLSNMKEA